jgi:hypothetical protein
MSNFQIFLGPLDEITDDLIRDMLTIFPEKNP